MVPWNPDLAAFRGPLAQRIAAALARDVETGRLRPGDRLPPQRALARALQVNISTVSRALAEAESRGLIEGEAGRGTFVRGRGRRAAPAPPPAEEGRGDVDLALNLPAGPAVAGAAATALAALARGDGLGELFDRYEPGGSERHRAAGATWLAGLGVPPAPDRTQVCGGAQHALAVSLSAVARPGDVLLAESLSYPGVKGIADLLRVKLAGVALDEAGLQPDAVEEACRKHAPRALYTMPTLQNPTGSIAPEERRREIAALARRFDLAILEDHTFAFLCSAPPPTYAALAPERTYSFAGTSKSLAAGLRIGYLRVPERAQGGGDPDALIWMAAPLSAEIAARWIEDGTARELVEWKRAETRARRGLLDRRLAPRASASDPASCHVWLELPEPWRAPEFADAAARRGVRIGPAEWFAIGRDATPHGVRLCIGTPPARADLERGLDALAAVLRGRPELHRTP